MPANAAGTIHRWVSAPEHNRGSVLAHPVHPSSPAGASAPQTPARTPVDRGAVLEPHHLQHTAAGVPVAGKASLQNGPWTSYRPGLTFTPTTYAQFPWPELAPWPGWGMQGSTWHLWEQSCFCHKILPRADLKILGLGFQLRRKDPCPSREKAGRLELLLYL